MLGDEWIRAGVLKRKANYSPILCFETVDPKRIYQLKEFVLSSKEFSNIEHVFCTDPWGGLEFKKFKILRFRTLQEEDTA